MEATPPPRQSQSSARLTTEHRPSNWALVRRLLKLGWRYRTRCIAVLALQITLVLLTLGGLGLTGVAIDVIRHHVDPTSSPPQWPLGVTPPSAWTAQSVLVFIAALVLAFALLNALIRYLAAITVADLTQRIVVRLRSEVYDKLQRLSFRFFDDNDSSSIINRVTADVQAVRMFVDGVIIRVVTVILSLSIYIGYMLSVHIPLTLACLMISPLLWWGAVVFSRMVQPAYLQTSKLVDALVLTLAENLQGIQVVKGFAREREEIAKFERANQRVIDQKRQIFWRISLFQPMMGLLTQLNMLILLGYGGYLVIRGELLLGAGLFVFANLLHEFANQVGQITNIANSIQTSLTGANRVFEVLDAPIEISSPPAPVRLPTTRGTVRFENVGFAYKPGEPVLHEIDLDVEPGQCIAIVGETGAGKSTLLSLIPRFYDPTAGRLLIDGIDLRRLRLDDLRRNIGIVFQEGFVFSNSIAANIAFGFPEASIAQIQRAARIAAAEEFIDELPDHYDTIIGEQGSNLSGGQRQRLAIARALLLDPPILILDDATAAVDSETEHEIQQSIENAMRGRTTFLVANRISTLRRADRILVLDKGRIIQTGTHDELLDVSQHYRNLALSQMADPADEELLETSGSLFRTDLDGSSSATKKFPATQKF